MSSKALALTNVVAVGGVAVGGSFTLARGTAQLTVRALGKTAQLRLRRGVLTGRLLGRALRARVGNPAARR
jgi:hypothetical protein